MINSQITWSWTKEETKSYERLMQAIADASVLAQPDIAAAKTEERPFVVYTNACGERLRAVLFKKEKTGY